jgi:hypothetical protein
MQFSLTAIFNFTVSEIKKKSQTIYFLFHRYDTISGPGKRVREKGDHNIVFQNGRYLWAGRAFKAQIYRF